MDLISESNFLFILLILFLFLIIYIGHNHIKLENNSEIKKHNKENLILTIENNKSTHKNHKSKIKNKNKKNNKINHKPIIKNHDNISINSLFDENQENKSNIPIDLTSYYNKKNSEINNIESINKIYNTEINSNINIDKILYELDTDVKSLNSLGNDLMTNYTYIYNIKD